MSTHRSNSVVHHQFIDLLLGTAVLAEMLTIEPEQVRTFLWDGTPETWSQMTLAESIASTSRVVFHSWQQLPEHDGIIQSVLETLTKVAYGLWPSWYGQDNLFSEEAISEAAILNSYRCIDCQGREAGVSLPWLKAAVQAQQQSKTQPLAIFPHALQLSQLALAIDPNGISLILALAEPHPPDHRLLALARASQWIATHSRARVALWLPQSLSQAAALDSVLYRAETLSYPPAVSRPAAVNEAKHVVFPIHGRPHPFSPGEQKLAQWLAQDAELSQLFSFNQLVKTIRSQAYLVDLLWSEGRLVVEIDGYRHHGNRFGFAQDRQRDYELLISDYIVLRLPHDEVVNDVEVAIEKIRDVVQFRRAQRCLTREVPL